MPKLLEVCAATLDDVQAAREGGADRIELNMALEVGGLTPTLPLFSKARGIFPGEILTMVRPRSGDFFYSADERQLLVDDAKALIDAGTDGIVFGGLRPYGTLDLDLIRSVRNLCGKRLCVFHRAIDLVDDWHAALRQLADSGVDRVLTSGQQATAMDGRKCLREMVEAMVGTPLQIVAGSGVSVENLPVLIRETGCQQFHGTFSRLIPEQCDGPVQLGQQRRTQVDLVAAAKKILVAA